MLIALIGLRDEVSLPAHPPRPQPKAIHGRSGGEGRRQACLAAGGAGRAGAARGAGGRRRAMTDYSEEQRNEVEALQSIYPDSFTVLSEKPTTFTITVTSEAGENDETVQTTLKFTYREKYPDETPLYEIVSQENLEDNDVTDIIKLLEQQVRKMEYLN
uniref:RWD domain-containing protein 1 n=1 Tax=Anser brachyrhynchus TaxID=132585 RepID=A0A8B9B7X5_9AVES